MKRWRGFRLGRRLARVWRWVVRRGRCCRPRQQRYIRLGRATGSDSSRNLYATPMMTTKLLDWGRLLARSLRSRGAGVSRLIGISGCAAPSAVAASAGLNLPLLEGGDGVGAPATPPKGHLAVYVGGEKEGGPLRRYLVPVIYFNHPLFGELLREAEEEFGFHHPGGITIPCPAAKFEHVRTRIAAAGDKLRGRGAASFLS